MPAPASSTEQKSSVAVKPPVKAPPKKEPAEAPSGNPFDFDAPDEPADERPAKRRRSEREDDDDEGNRSGKRRSKRDDDEEETTGDDNLINPRRSRAAAWLGYASVGYVLIALFLILRMCVVARISSVEGIIFSAAFAGVGILVAGIASVVLRRASSRIAKTQPRGAAIAALVFGILTLIVAALALLRGGSMLYEVLRGAWFDDFGTTQMYLGLGGALCFGPVALLSAFAGIRVLIARDPD